VFGERSRIPFLLVCYVQGKGRMTVLDVSAVTKELRKKLIGSRLANSTRRLQTFARSGLLGLTCCNCFVIYLQSMI
jgi:hypothetical protein